MTEANQCAGCLAWSYQNSDFSKAEGERMTGWCRVWSKDTNQSYGCAHFSSRAEQEADYLASLKSKQGGAYGLACGVRLPK